ncbi:MAG: lipocalin family protein [Bacteroidia bacterium]
MKNLFLIITAAALFASCSEEPSTPSTNGNGGGSGNAITIEGTWNLGSIAQNNGQISLAGTVLSTYTSVSSNEQGSITFHSDGTLTSTDVGYTATQTMTTAGIPNTTSQEISPTSSSGTYTYDSNSKKLTIEVPGSPTQEAVVSEMTASKLVYTTMFEQVNSAGGIESKTTAEIVTTLTR